MTAVTRQRRADESSAAPLVLALVGTDVHRFDRLVEWLENWYAARRAAGTAPRLLVQYGSSRPAQIPGAVDFLAHDDLRAAMAEATLVVSHGGPATITEARRHGRLPIVVPRDPAYREHVDNHQQLFSRRLADAGMVRLAESAADLAAELDEGLADPRRYILAADPDAPDPRLAAVAAVGRIVEELVAQRSRRTSSSRRWWR